jgi:hypothetical protein
LAEAAYRATTTLTFIQPEIYLTAVLDRLKEDLDPSPLSTIGLEERGIWATPDDQLFVDGKRRSSVGLFHADGSPRAQERQCGQQEQQRLRQREVGARSSGLVGKEEGRHSRCQALQSGSSISGDADGQGEASPGSHRRSSGKTQPRYRSSQKFDRGQLGTCGQTCASFGGAFARKCFRTRQFSRRCSGFRCVLGMFAA